MIVNFILDEHHNLVPEPDIVKWADWWEANRFMADEKPAPGVRVATIFLGFDHNHSSDTPAFFETTVFCGHAVVTSCRYPTYGAAMKGHQELVDKVKPEVRL